ncbi:MAG: hypothetical protein HY660_12670 [Armatimonadetes bacterium]|nr:hypothetical protein [Armatimonadota bacterium]
MVPTDPYVTGLLQENFFAQKSPVAGRLVVVLRGHLEGRELELIPQPSRAVTAGEVHELVAVDEPKAGPGRVVNRVAFLGFVEFLSGGVLVAGDEVRVGGRVVGRLAGYDLTHMPNHMNLVILTPGALSGEEMGLELGAAVGFAGSGEEREGTHG